MNILETILSLLAAAALLTGVALSKMGSKNRMEFRTIFVGIAVAFMAALLLVQLTEVEDPATTPLVAGIALLLLSLAYSAYGVSRMFKAKRRSSSEEPEEK